MSAEAKRKAKYPDGGVCGQSLGAVGCSREFPGGQMLPSRWKGNIAVESSPHELRVVSPPDDGQLEPDRLEDRLEPTPELLAELARVSDEFEAASPPEILAWAARRFGTRLTMATAFGPEGMTILHMLAEVAPETHVFNLDTGYQFPETLELRERVLQRYGLAVEFKRADMSPARYEELHGGPVYKTNPDQCCHDRKIVVLRRAIKGFHAWISAIRRDQSPDRAQAPIVGWDKKFGLVKVNPLANWSKSDVWGLITKQDIPYNPLHDEGYVSIGCEPCTRPVMFGEDERAGRWSGTGKTECGLHSLDED